MHSQHGAGPRERFGDGVVDDEVDVVAFGRDLACPGVRVWLADDGHIRGVYPRGQKRA